LILTRLLTFYFYLQSLKATTEFINCDLHNTENEFHSNNFTPAIMNKTLKCCSLVLIIFATATMVNAQTISLSTFDSSRKQLGQEMKLTGKEAEKVHTIYAQLDKQLLNLNEEINGKTEDQVKSLIEKKYKKANESLSTVLSPTEYKQAQALNQEQMTTLTKGLIGTNGILETKGLIGTNGIIETKGKRSANIVVGTARER
jgi:hypothetical protein